MNLSYGETGLYTIVRNALIQIDPDTLHEEIKIPMADSDIIPSRKACLTVIMGNELKF